MYHGILNMSITSTVMAAAFAAIYIISCNNVNSEILKKLNPQAGMQTVIKGTELPDNVENSKPKTLNRRVSPDYSDSFIIHVDGNGEILEIDSPFDMREESYGKAAEIAWNNKNNGSAITLDCENNHKQAGRRDICRECGKRICSFHFHAWTLIYLSECI